MTVLATRASRPAADVPGWLGLAAAPTFGVMAWISAAGAPGMTMCSVAPAFLPISDMGLMYLLMSVFHVSPWLKLLSARSRGGDTSTTQTEGE